MSRTVPHLNQSLASAVDLFVMTKFDQCFSICNDVIKTAKTEPEQERNYEVIEAATALGIQALAETDMWHEVIAFITDVYGTIDLCPPRIIQVCILLHAHVKEYLPCHRLVQTWLRSPYNLSHKQCAQVIRIYAHHILCPTGSYETLKEIVNSCKSLNDTEREMLLQVPQINRYAEARKATSEIELPDSLADDVGAFWDRISSENISGYFQNPAVSFSDEASDEIDDEVKTVSVSKRRECKEKSSSVSLSSRLYQGCAMVWRYLQNQGFSLFIMAALAVWALIQTQSGKVEFGMAYFLKISEFFSKPSSTSQIRDPVSTLGRLVVLWRGFLHKLGLSAASK